MTTVTQAARRQFLQRASLSCLAASAPFSSFAQSTAGATSATNERPFSPQVGPWRSFDVTVRVDLAATHEANRLWLPLPSINGDWQQSSNHRFTSNGQASVQTLPQGVSVLAVQFDKTQDARFAEVTSTVKTLNRNTEWTAMGKASAVDPGLLKTWTAPSRWLPTDGIVRQTALQATKGSQTDVEKVQKLYDWIIANTFREPKVRGCGEGDIKTMLETGNLSGKCADLNALFVGLCRAAGVPARDVYGLRLAPSVFPYKELGGNSGNLKGAQHCRAEVYLAGFGWVPMDPADVTKVMRQETADWIKNADHPVVAPVKKALFGSWEGNWMAYNTAHDVVLPGSSQGPVPFMMYPVAEGAAGLVDSYAPDAFKYQISATETKV